MRWVNELTDYNFKLRYRLGKIGQDSDHLSRVPIAESHTNEVDLENVSKLFLNSCLLLENNWLSISSVTENNLEKRWNLEPENKTSKIKNTLKTEQEDYFISLRFC